ncbi:hypothetical protein LTR36_010042 [Oleoguttula mirabilis]|uniref:DNA (cytosine-5-)-methyltransferase n=1 Tax=Oleoguttula mirabilis TaxID=1507867 RepID=A0AAV9JR95_9PEZI|nr:hypothetical protein LTR36_010042 [Oleoguttula mirabilis]
MAYRFAATSSSKRKSIDRSDQHNMLTSISDLTLEEEEEEGEVSCGTEDSSDEGEDTTPEPGISRLANPQARQGGCSKAFSAPTNHTYKARATTSSGVKITRGADCELLPASEFVDGDFLRVKRIILDTATNETLLEGILFRRSRFMDMMLRKSTNELCAVLTEVDPQVPDPALDDYMVQVPLESVCCVRNIILTNRLFGGDIENRKFADLSFRDDRMDATVARDHGVLVCRWKRIEYSDAAGRKGQKGVILHLRSDESDPDKAIPNAANVHYWRELAHYDGVPTACPPGTVFDLTEEDEEYGSREKSKRAKRDDSRGVTGTIRKVRRTVTIDDMKDTYLDAFGKARVERTIRSESLLTDTLTSFAPAPKSKLKRTFNDRTSHQPSALDALVSEERTHFDICCGAGGMATGVQKSGSTLKFLLDMDADACNTVRLAFPDRKTEVLNIKVHTLFHDRRYAQRSFKVVTAHISYPCKTISAAHTGPVVTAKDFENEDTSASVDNILKATRIKVLTFEQTSHMVIYSKNRLLFRRQVRDLTFQGYSVRWQLMDAIEHGNASKRDRLITLASCPGHPLPEFPSPRPGPKTTTADVLRQKPRKRDLDPWMLQSSPKNELPWNPNTQLGYTITCNGGQGDVHPSGLSTFDMQELAQMAGFPPERKFAQAGKTKLRELIGNAVPSGLAYDIYGEVHKALDQGEVDMFAWLAGGSAAKKEVEKERGGRKKEVIVLDDEEDAVVVEKKVIVID